MVRPVVQRQGPTAGFVQISRSRVTQSTGAQAKRLYRNIGLRRTRWCRKQSIKCGNRLCIPPQRPRVRDAGVRRPKVPTCTVQRHRIANSRVFCRALYAPRSIGGFTSADEAWNGSKMRRTGGLTIRDLFRPNTLGTICVQSINRFLCVLFAANVCTIQSNNECFVFCSCLRF